MKFNLSQELIGIDGETAMTQIKGGERPLTVGDVLRAALNTPLEGDKLEQFVSCGLTALAIAKGEDVDIPTEQLKERLMKSGYLPMICAQVIEQIEK